MSTRKKSRRAKPINILISDIRYTTFCVNLDLPLDLCCDYCKKRKDPLSTNRNSSTKRFRNKDEKRRCEQIWLSKFSENTCKTTTGKILMHNKV